MPLLRLLAFVGLCLSISLVVSVQPAGALQTNAEVFLLRSTDGGQSFDLSYNLSDSAEDNGTPHVFADGGTVNVVYDSGPQPREVKLRRSTDAGVGFDLAQNLSQNSGDSGESDIGGSGSNINVVWEEDRLLGTAPDPCCPSSDEAYARHSSNAGVGFDTAVNVTNTATIHNTDPDVAQSGLLVGVVVEDQSVGAADIKFHRSTDGGATWGPEITVHSDADQSSEPAVAISGTTVHVVFEDRAEGVRYVRSTDSGASFTTTSILGGTNYSRAAPVVTAVGNTVHIVACENRASDDTAEPVYFRSTDNGTSWSGPFPLLAEQGAWRCARPSVAANGTNVYVTYQGSLPAGGVGDEEIFFLRSTDAGVGWTSATPSPTQITNNDGDSRDPIVTVDPSNGSLYVVWFDFSTPTPPAPPTPNVGPTLTIDDVQVTEGNAGTTTATFTVSLGGSAPTGAISVNWATADGTATTAGNDYVAGNGTLNWALGDTAPKTIQVTVNGDALYEAEETYGVTLSNPVNATLLDGDGAGAITNDDAAPTVSINDVSTTEGNSGMKAFGFTVSLSAPTGKSIVVDYATANGTATGGGSDYQSASGSLTWLPGDPVSKPVNINVVGDAVAEPDETFFVNISTATSGIFVTDPQGLGTIQNDDSGGTPVGMLRVTTSPAVPSQIVVDGVPRDTWALTWMKIATGSHGVCFTDVAGFTTPACQNVNVTDGQTSTVEGVFAARGSLRVLTNPAVPGTILVDGVPRNDWGMWTDLPPATYQVCFGLVAGADPPPCQNAVVTAGNLTTITGIYASNGAAPGPTNVGFLRVTANPAVPTQIVVDGIPRDTWGLTWMKIAPGAHEVCFTDVGGFTTPACQNVNVTDGLTTAVEGVFAARGSLRVLTNPAVPGTILVDGVPRNDWGMWTSLPPATYQVCFGPVAGLTEPACQNAAVTAGTLTTITGNYT